jgi:hypothetical protein
VCFSEKEGGILESKETKWKNAVQKFYKITKSKKGDFQPRISMYLYKDKYGNVTGKDGVETEMLAAFFLQLLNNSEIQMKEQMDI